LRFRRFAKAAETFASMLFPRTPKLLRTEPLKALVIGAFVRGLSMRDVESLCEQAGLGRLSKSTASRMCEELRERFEAFRRRDLYEIRLVALFLDATFIAVRPDGPKEGVRVAWGFTEDGERVLLAVALGMRESFEDWQALGRDLISRGLGAPMLIVADGAPGLVKACWPASDRQRCCVHRARSLYAKLPDRERERVRHAYWQASDDAISETDAKRRLLALVDDLDKGGFTAAARCLADDLDALVVHLRYPVRHRRRWRSADESVRGCGSISGSCLSRFPVLVAEVGGCEGVARRQGCRRNTVRMGLASAWGVESPRPGRGRCWQQGVLGLRLAQGVVDPGAKRRFWD